MSTIAFVNRSIPTPTVKQAREINGYFYLPSPPPPHSPSKYMERTSGCPDLVTSSKDGQQGSLEGNGMGQERPPGR